MSDPDRSRRRRFWIRTLLLAIAVVAAWLTAFRVPGVGPLVLGALGGVAVVGGLFLGVMGLGYLGFGLLAL